MALSVSEPVYLSVSELLAILEIQQRRELAALSERVGAVELQQVRDAKKCLYAVAVFFIERSWDILAPQLQTFSLEAENGQSPDALRAYLENLRQQQPAFAWGWLRARMNARLMHLLDACILDLIKQCPEQAALYTECLGSLDDYWFRKTPEHHLKAGYHTALAVACKWYGTAYEQLAATHSCPDAAPCFREELRQFATFSMTMLARTDFYLWNSAGAEPMDAVLEDGTLKIAPKTIETLSLDNAPDYGLRLGCPALRARQQEGLSAFLGMIAWVEQVFGHYLLDAKPCETGRASEDSFAGEECFARGAQEGTAVYLKLPFHGGKA